jgi:hypothetical protein
MVIVNKKKINEGEHERSKKARITGKKLVLIS